MGETLGLAALVWSYLSVLVGLLFSTRRPRWAGLSRRQINNVHRQLSLTTIALILGHALFVAVGGMNDAMTARAVSFAQAFVPFQASWNQWPYAFGIFSLYLALILGPTYYLKGRLGARAWTVVHRLSLAVYILAVVHTIYFDDFDFHGPYRAAVWVAQIPLAAMLLWRVASPVSRTGRGNKARPGSQGALTALLIARAGVAVRLVVGTAAAAILAGMVIILATGRIGGTPSLFHPQALTTSSSTPKASNQPSRQA
jgi:DMSO/TMAO reductase YedYZ heme-binding membrane subunit